ncbi:MAG: PAS domain-containing protein [Rhodoferax sp.]|nr:PAS domain-containing protein [Rhodoferax sp.]
MKQLLDAANRTIASQKVLHQAMLETAQDGYWLVDSQGRFQEVNAAYCRMSGYSREELLTMGISDVEAIETMEQTARHIEQVMSAGSTRFESRHRRKDGSSYPVEISTMFLKELDGVFTVMVRDLTELNAAQTLMLQSHDLLGKLSANVPGMIFQLRLSPDGSLSFPFASAGIEVIYECSPIQVRLDASMAFARHHLEDGAAFITSLQDSARTLQPWTCSYRVTLPRRGERWLSGSAMPQRQGDGSVLWHGFISDITEQKELSLALSESEARWTYALNGSGYGVCDWNIPQGTAFFSRQWKSMLGYSADDIGGMVDEWVKRVHPDDVDRVMAEIQEHMNGNTDFTGIEHRLLCKDGSWKWVLGRGVVVNRDQDGRPLRFVGTNVDITQRKNLEEQQWKLHREIEAAQATAVAANHAKSRFLANMGHELRTPLNAVIGFSRLMSESIGLTETQKKYVSIINRSGNHLLTLINDVLEIAKIDAGRIELHEEATDVGLLSQDVADMLRQRAEQAGLELVLERDVLEDSLQVDAVKLRQVLINLLGNAIKFTQQGRVILRVRTRPGPNQRVYLDVEVRDTGIGIAPQDQQAIFEPFVQIVTHATSAGNGLGLTITRQYLQMMGGELQLESAPGVGSCFRFTLNLAPASSLKAVPTELSRRVLAQADQGKRILVADDDPDTRELLRELLLPMGFIVAEAADGIEAVVQTRRFEPDLIIMDRRMPVLNGLDASKRIRAQPAYQRTRIIMLTASAFDEQRQEALAAGVDDYLRKPLQEDELYAAIELHLHIHFQFKSITSPTNAAATAVAVAMPTTTASVNAAALATLPPALRQALRVATEELNRTKLLAVLEHIAPDNAALARGITAMADEFRYRELWELIGP